jgi:hypothetical protein
MVIISYQFHDRRAGARSGVTCVMLFCMNRKPAERKRHYAEDFPMIRRNHQRAARMGARILVLALILGGAPHGYAESGSANAQSFSHRQMSSMGDSLLRAGNEPLHILYLHGIGATGAGDSLLLRQSICNYLKDCTSPAGDSHGREYADQGEYALTSQPPTLTYMGSGVWMNQQEWNASDPFVDHYVLTRKTGKSILVDEINWWPLVFPLKCRNILPEEAKLAGTDGNYLNICATLAPDIGTPGRYDFYPWIPLSMATSLESGHSKAVVLNRKLKIDLMDWSFSDALLAVGPMHELLIEGIRQLVVKSVAASGDQSKALATGTGSGNGSESEYMVISHSLGSFLVFSALNPLNENTGTPAADAVSRTKIFSYVLGHMEQAYFFANQVPLLELAKLGGESHAVAHDMNASIPGDQTDQASAAQGRPSMKSSFIADLAYWTIQRMAFQKGPADLAHAIGGLSQIVAWSDPNDLLSWQLPDIEGVDVVNLYPKNAIHWLWLFENPLAAHDNYAKNKKVIQALLRPMQNGRSQ